MMFDSLNFNAGTLFRACLICFFIIVDFSFILVMSMRIANIGTYFGFSVFSLLIVVLLFWKKCLSVLSSDNTVVKYVSRVVLFLFLAGVLLAVVFSVSMIIYAKNKSEEPCPVVAVLGCKVNGSTPSLMLYARINAAFEYLSENPESVCIACGGQGEDEDVTEAFAIKTALVEMGIEPSRIYLEDTSVDTEQNLKNAYKIAKDNGFGEKAAIVTDGFHQMRSQLLASDCGFEAYAVSAKTEDYLLPTYWIREWFALCEYFILK